MLKLFSQIEELQEKEIVLSDDEVEISMVGKDPEVELSVNMANEFSFWPPILYATHSYALGPGNGAEAFISFASGQAVSSFGVDYQFDPILRVSV